MTLRRSQSTVTVRRVGYDQHHLLDLTGRLAQVDYLVLATSPTTLLLPFLLMGLSLCLLEAESVRVGCR